MTIDNTTTTKRKKKKCEEKRKTNARCSCTIKQLTSGVLINLSQSKRAVRCVEEDIWIL